MRRPSDRRLLVEREEMECSASRAGEGAEVSLVEREDVEAPIAVSEHDDRGVCEAEVQISIPTNDGRRGGDVSGAKFGQLIGPVGDLVEEP